MPMSKCILVVGNCRPDHAAIRSLLERHFDATVIQAHTREDCLDSLRDGGFALILVNRELDRDSCDGLTLIRAIKENPDLANTAVMLISNFPEYQAQAVEAGALQGFGKGDLHSEQTLERLRGVLGVD